MRVGKQQCDGPSPVFRAKKKTTSAMAYILPMVGIAAFLIALVVKIV